MKQILLEKGRDGIRFHVGLVAGRRADNIQPQTFLAEWSCSWAELKALIHEPRKQ